MGSADPLENGWKIKKRNHAKKSSFLCLCYILRAIRADRCRQRRYADHIFIQKYFRMHHFVLKFSKFSSPQAARGHWPPQPKSCGRSCVHRRLSRRPWLVTLTTRMYLRGLSIGFRSARSPAAAAAAAATAAVAVVAAAVAVAAADSGRSEGSSAVSWFIAPLIPDRWWVSDQLTGSISAGNPNPKLTVNLKLTLFIPNSRSPILILCSLLTAHQHNTAVNRYSMTVLDVEDKISGLGLGLELHCKRDLVGNLSF